MMRGDASTVSQIQQHRVANQMVQEDHPRLPGGADSNLTALHRYSLQARLADRGSAIAGTLVNHAARGGASDYRTHFRAYIRRLSFSLRYSCRLRLVIRTLGPNKHPNRDLAVLNSQLPSQLSKFGKQTLSRAVPALQALLQATPKSEAKTILVRGLARMHAARAD